MKNKFTLSFLLTAFLSFASFAQNLEKDLVNKWKMIKTELDGKSVTPVHDKLILELKKDKTFLITAAFEETHSGSWTLSDDKKKVTLKDSDSDYIQDLTILDTDDNHLTLGNFDAKDMTLSFIPLGKDKNQHLDHVEHSLVKKWTCFETTNDQSLGMMLEFKADKTFLIIPLGYKIPVAAGSWKLNDSKDKILVDKQDGGHMELTIVERHKHELVLKQDDTEVVNHFHDPKYTRLDQQKGIFNKKLPLHSEESDKTKN